MTFETSYFLSDADVDLLNQYGFEHHEFKKPVFIPKSGSTKQKALWSSLSAVTISSMIKLTNMNSMQLAPLIGLSVGTLNRYKDGKSQFFMAYSNWRLLCEVAAAVAAGRSLPNDFIISPDEHKYLLAFFDETALRYPSRAENGYKGAILWDAVPPIEAVKNALNHLCEYDYTVGSMMVEWHLQDREVRRKKKDLQITFAEFVILVRLLANIKVEVDCGSI